MPNTIKYLAWNVENFHNDDARIPKVVDLLVNEDPDIFALFEVKGKKVFWEMMTRMPDYQFKATESESVPEIVIGIRKNLTAFFTQRDELNSKVPTLRPGALTTLSIDGKLLSFLFLHLKSFPEPRSWGLRDDMFAHVASLKRTLDRQMPEGVAANFLALGDLNTMGMSAAYNDELDIDGAKELSFVDQRMGNKRHKMRRLQKSHDATWWSGKSNWNPSDLDHVYAAEHLTFSTQANDSEVKVSGWIEQPNETRQIEWIESMSDHCVLIGEVKVDSLN